jgi:hypothetical protein
MRAVVLPGMRGGTRRPSYLCSVPATKDCKSCSIVAHPGGARLVVRSGRIHHRMGILLHGGLSAADAYRRMGRLEVAMIFGVELLEQAVALCRANRSGAMAAYWIGTAPFVTGVLYACQAITHGADAGEQVLPMSFVLAILWTWMNFWHTVYCDGLWRSVADQPNEPWSLGRATRVLLTNAAIQGPGMFVLAMAAVVTLPFPWAHAFYQNAHVYAARFDLRETARNAALNAGLWPKQNWQIMACMLLLATLLFLNTLMAIAICAQLLNSIFGIETALVQNRVAILGLPYLAAAGCATFLVLDPIWKAAYVIRCFHGESKRSGADLRLLLRRVATTALLLCTSFEIRAQTAPPVVDKYDKAIKEVLHRPEYEWSSSKQATAPRSQDSAVRRVLQNVGVWVEKSMTWLEDWLRKMSARQDSSRPGPPPGAGLRWAVLGTLALCFAIVVILILKFRARRTSKQTAAAGVASIVTVDITNEAVTPDQLPVNEWLQLADGFLRDGDTRLAARAVYLATLSQLDSEKLITLGRHKTNLEYEREIARRGRSVPHAGATFRRIAATFERSWYGRHAVAEELVVDLRTSLTALKVNA